MEHTPQCIKKWGDGSARADKFRCRRWSKCCWACRSYQARPCRRRPRAAICTLHSIGPRAISLTMFNRIKVFSAAYERRSPHIDWRHRWEIFVRTRFLLFYPNRRRDCALHLAAPVRRWMRLYAFFRGPSGSSFRSAEVEGIGPRQACSLLLGIAPARLRPCWTTAT